MAALLDAGAFEDEGVFSLVVDGSQGFLAKLTGLKELEHVGMLE